ncbi:hypothetical protein OC834_005368 [Tilletia horrida]|nr:hypothetical protein OC834_005368 [Tilletia horrida]
MAISPADELPPSYADAAGPSQPAGNLPAPVASADLKQQQTKTGPAAIDNEGPLGSNPDAGPSSSGPPPAFSDHRPQVYVGGRRTEAGGMVPSFSSSGDLGEHFRPAEANLLTLDAHLNEDGEALYRFLLKTALTPPKVSLKIRGWHEEYRDVHSRHHVWRDGCNNNNRAEQRFTINSSTRSETTTVVDFDFKIDLGPLLTPSISKDRASLQDPRNSPVRHPVQHNPTVYVKPDADVAYRGRMVEEVLARPSDYRHLPRIRRPAQLSASNNTLASGPSTDEATQSLLADTEMNAANAPAYAEAGSAGVESADDLVLLQPSWSERRAIKKAAAKRQLPWTQANSDIQCVRGIGAKMERVSITDSSTPDFSLGTVDVRVIPAEGISRTTARTVADDYALNPKELKEFIVKKHVIGWDVKALEEAVKQIVEGAFPTGAYDMNRHIEVNFTVENDTVTVVPDNGLARFASTLQRTHGAKRVLLIILIIITGAFLILLPAMWLLRHFKGARYNTVGIVWQLSEWEELPADIDSKERAIEWAISKEREDAARAGAKWAVDDETRCPVEALTDEHASSADPGTPFERRSCISARGVPRQQPFIIGHNGRAFIVHRGIRQGDVVRAWESRIRSAVINRLRQDEGERMGGAIYEHLAPQILRSYDPLTGQESYSYNYETAASRA